MNRRTVAIAILLLLAAGAAPAGAGGTSIGARYGWANATGRLFRGGPDLDECNLAGAQLGLALGPRLRAEIAGEYVSRPFRFAKGVFEGIEAAGRGDFQDITLLATGTIDLLALPGFPLAVYGGAGANVHFSDVQVDELTELGSGGASAALEDAVARVTGKSTRVGWHGVAGVRCDLPALPLSIFVEGRYQDPFQHEHGVPTTKSVYGGANLRL